MTYGTKGEQSNGHDKSGFLGAAFSFLCGTFLLLSARAAVAYEYEATGTLDGVRFLFERKPESIAPVSFHVYVRDCKWLIRARAKGDSVESEIGFDGTHQYNYGVYLKALPGEDSWSGGVRPEGVPFFGPIPSIPIIWLALADSCYLEKGARSMVPPYSEDMPRMQLVIHAVRRQSAPRLLEEMVFVDDGYDRTGIELRKRRPPYDKGFTRAVFSAGTFTNIGGCELPLAFSLRVFRPSRAGGSADDLDLMFQYEGHIKDVGSTCSIGAFAPQVPTAAGGVIRDFRFALPEALDPQPFTYGASNWLSVDEVRQLPGFAEYLRMQPLLKNNVAVALTPAVMTGSVARRRGVLVALCALAVISAVSIYMLLKRSSRGNAPTEQ